MAKIPVKAVTTINAQAMKLCLYITAFMADTHERRVPLNAQYQGSLADEEVGS